MPRWTPQYYLWRAEERACGEAVGRGVRVAGEYGIGEPRAELLHGAHHATEHALPAWTAEPLCDVARRAVQFLVGTKRPRAPAAGAVVTTAVTGLALARHRGGCAGADGCRGGETSCAPGGSSWQMLEEFFGK
jgi:hypothetical protein